MTHCDSVPRSKNAILVAMNCKTKPHDFGVQKFMYIWGSCTIVAPSFGLISIKGLKVDKAYAKDLGFDSPTISYLKGVGDLSDESNVCIRRKAAD